MRGFFRRLAGALRQAFAIDYLNKSFLKFAIMHTVYMAATVCTTTFTNTLIMRVSTDSNATLWYNIVLFFMEGVSMCLAAKLLHTIGTKKTIAIAISFSMLTYLLVLIFMNQMDVMYPVVAGVQGIATGLYWIVYFESLLLYSTDETRDLSMNFIGMFSGFVSIVIPLIAGIVIGAFISFEGYYIIFAVFFVMAIFAIWLATRLDNGPPDKKKTHFGMLFKEMYTTKLWFCAIHTDFSRGLREGSFAFFVNVLIFEIVKSEAVIGINTFVVGIVSMISCFIAGKITRPNNRIKLFVGSTITLMLVISLMFWQLNLVTVLLLAATNSFLGVYLSNPVTTTLYTVFDKLPETRIMQNEAISVSDMYKCFGRCLGVFLIMAFPSGNFWSVLALFILAATQFVTAYLAKATLKETNRLEALKNA